jgi:hypothetical protein
MLVRYIDVNNFFTANLYKMFSQNQLMLSFQEYESFLQGFVELAILRPIQKAPCLIFQVYYRDLWKEEEVVAASSPVKRRKWLRWLLYTLTWLVILRYVVVSLRVEISTLYHEGMVTYSTVVLLQTCLDCNVCNSTCTLQPSTSQQRYNSSRESKPSQLFGLDIHLHIKKHTKVL